jgi:NYN domain
LKRVAVFADAAYLFHFGGVSLAGARQERIDLLLDVSNVVAELKFLASVRAPSAAFLRIYWYDVFHPGARLTSDQALLANADDVKLRLGSAPALGPYRSLASEIAGDLIELSRHGALGDALVISADEDLRIPIQLAQSYGVRVHLVGLASGRGSHSTPLTQEVDTNTEWPRETLQRFLAIRRGALQDCAQIAPYPGSAFSDPREWEPRLEGAAREFADALDDNDLDALEAYWATSRGVPSELDRRLLPFARNALGRDLDQTEKRFVRSCFQKQVMDRFEQEDAEEVE